MRISDSIVHVIVGASAASYAAALADRELPVGSDRLVPA
jgi:hypothetical protein